MYAEMSSCPTNFDFAEGMRRMRRQASRISTVSLSESTDISGEATLCFDEQGTSFHGVIIADDRSNYSIVGKKTSKRKMSNGKNQE